jgi:chemotaxis protein methyltransferase CheR
MITESEFRLFRDLVYDESGISLEAKRKSFLENRLALRLAATGAASPYAYYRYLLKKKETELLILLDMLSIHETSFFRYKAQFDLFGDTMLPNLTGGRRTAGSRTLRFWSAGCSTGEEPYTMAMVLLEKLPAGEDWDVRVYASDLSLASLEKASRAEYTRDKVTENVPPEYIEKYFEPTEEGYRVGDRVREMVVLDYHNLRNENGLIGLDAIFCRNVMIYFDLAVQKQLLAKFYEKLRPGGYLLLGHAESLQGMDTGFKFVSGSCAGAYRKAAGERAYEGITSGR